MSATSLPDGAEALKAELKLGDAMRLIESTARWVDPETFNLLPVWYPEHARRALLYKGNWAEPRMNKNRKTRVSVHKTEGNSNANMGLTRSLGLRRGGRKNWSCCHIWGVDDPSYQEANVVVQDHRFFSCVANMVLLPTPLKAFTDAMPDVKAMLRICARNLYEWQCDHESMSSVNAELDEWQNWDDYPGSWPRKAGTTIPIGVMPINTDIRKSASRRRQKIKKDFEIAGPNYPREKVLEALAYWKIDLAN
ncbi:MAG: hypothetical protein ACTSV1_06335 [Alphaproteobacteria bacterium]